MSEQPGYALLDPRPIAAGAPYTFFLPDPAERAAIAPGDQVKLMFEHVPPRQEWGVERMWVTVTAVSASGMMGVLDNIPYEPTASLVLGDPIAFEQHHVIAIRWDDPAAALAEQRGFWERCMVDQCVLDGAEPVEYLYRETSDPELEADDKYADSGWRLRGRMGDATDAEIEARKAAYVALGAVLNCDDSWLHLIDAPVGSAFMRDFDTGDYVPAEE